MALYIHGPLRCKNLLGRIPNPNSCHALAAPQHTPGPRSDARSQRTPPGGDHAQSSSTTPRRSTGSKTPSTTRTPTIRPPGGIPDIRSTHPHGPDQTPSRPRWKLCSTRSPTRSAPQTARKPARLPSRTGFFFCMMEQSTAQRTRSERTTQPDRRPCCPLHPQIRRGEHHQHDHSPMPSKSHTEQRPALEASRRPRREQQPPRPRSDHPRTSRQTGTRCTRPCDGKAPGGHRPARTAATPRPPANLAA